MSTVNKESVIIAIPKLVGKPSLELSQVTQAKAGSVLQILVPKSTTSDSVYVSVAGEQPWYQTEYRDGQVGIVPVDTSQLSQLEEAVQISVLTDQPVHLNDLQGTTVPTYLIPQEFLTQGERENAVRQVLNFFKDQVEVVQGDPNSTIVGLGTLELSPKVVAIKDLTGEYFQKIKYPYVTALWENVTVVDADGQETINPQVLVDRFLESVTRPVASVESLNNCVWLTQVGVTPRERFFQTVVQASLIQIFNQASGGYYDQVQLVFPLDMEEDRDVIPAILLTQAATLTLLRLNPQAEGLIFESAEKVNRYFRESEGYTHVGLADLSIPTLELVLEYLANQPVANWNMDTVVRFLLPESLPTEVEGEVQLTEGVVLQEAVSKVDLAKREKIETLMKEVFNNLDKSGLNTKRYQEELFALDDTAFFRFIKQLLADPKKNLELQVLPGKNEPRLEDIKVALNVLGVPETEYVYMRHEGDKNNPLRSRYKQTVGYIHIRRLQQLLSKKNTYSLSIGQRNLKNNQVTGKDAIARISDLEVSALKAVNADAILKELMGPRADAADMKVGMYNQISNFGYAELKQMNGKLENKRTLNTVSQYLLGAGLDNDLLVDSRRLINQVEEV